MNDTVEYTDGNYVSLSIEELPYERADENDYHLKFSETNSLENDNDLVPLPVPKTKRRQRVVKKQKKKTKKYRKNLRSNKTRLRSA